tara:strand:+ start:605 stop:973 length:369 start_codon:yes stop_codon:yes gene_type:complete
MKKGTLLLSAALAVSLFVNTYLFNLVLDWQEAWTEQILTTSHVERLYTKSGADVSFVSVQELVEKELGEYEVIPVLESDNQGFGSDSNAILIHGSKLFFKDGVYLGSKANVPEHLVHWRMGQ